jgi:zinc transporter ZupT
VLNLQSGGGSLALVIASVWTGVVHLALGILGTFVLKRFPTSFSVGFLLGVLVVLANQNLILFATFTRYGHGTPQTNHTFALLGFTLFCVLSFMALLLVHFKQEVVVAPMDVKSKADADDASYEFGERGPSTPVSQAGTASP